MIRKLPDETRRRIKAQQHVQGTYLIVKELVENAIDAGSTSVKIRIDGSIAVEDDGFGIDDIEKVGIEGNTSKEHMSYRVLGCIDTTSRTSHGFRGQALSSIADICDLEVVSRSKHSFALKKDFSSGAITECARERGTTVQVSNLFKNCPIRRSINESNMKKDLNRLCRLLESYSCVNEIHFTLFYKRKILLSCNGFGTPEKYFDSKYPDFIGRYLKVENKLMDLLLLPVSVKEMTQMVFFDRRPISSRKIMSTIKSEFNLYATGMPTFILVVKGTGDVNLSVDKSKAIFSDENAIVNLLKSEISRFLSSEVHLGMLGSGSLPTSRGESIQEIDKKLGNSGVHRAFETTLTCHSRLTKLVDDAGVRTALQDIAEHTHSKSRPIMQERTTDSSIPSIPDDPNAGETVRSAEEVKCGEEPDVLASASSENNVVKIGNSIKRSAYSLFEHDEYVQPKLRFRKEDFTKLEVIGQFNNGFIITKLERDKKTYLIAVDQHAADEIKNFEMIKSKFHLKKQRTIVPVSLSLTPIDEMTVNDHSELFNRNGFVVKHNMLETVPVYKNEVFGIGEFYEFLDDVKNGKYDFAKVRNIIASKACRTSVMIGDVLSMSDMRRIVGSLASLDRPWKCPHGRPTFMVLNETTEV